MSLQGGRPPERPFAVSRPHLDSRTYRSICRIFSACLEFERLQQQQNPAQNPKTACKEAAVPPIAVSDSERLLVSTNGRMNSEISGFVSGVSQEVGNEGGMRGEKVGIGGELQEKGAILNVEDGSKPLECCRVGDEDKCGEEGIVLEPSRESLAVMRENLGDVVELGEQGKDLKSTVSLHESEGCKMNLHYGLNEQGEILKNMVNSVVIGESKLVPGCDGRGREKFLDFQDELENSSPLKSSMTSLATGLDNSVLGGCFGMKNTNSAFEDTLSDSSVIFKSAEDSLPTNAASGFNGGQNGKKLDAGNNSDVEDKMLKLDVPLPLNELSAVVGMISEEVVAVPDENRSTRHLSVKEFNEVYDGDEVGGQSDFDKLVENGKNMMSVDAIGDAEVVFSGCTDKEEKCVIGDKLIKKGENLKFAVNSPVSHDVIMALDNGVGKQTNIMPPSTSLDVENESFGEHSSCQGALGNKEAVNLVGEGCGFSGEVNKVEVSLDIGGIAQKDHSSTTLAVADKMLESVEKHLQFDDDISYNEHLQLHGGPDEDMLVGVISDFSGLINSNCQEASKSIVVAGSELQNHNIVQRDEVISVNHCNLNPLDDYKTETEGVDVDTAKDLGGSDQAHLNYDHDFAKNTPCIVDTEGKTGDCDDLEEGEIEGAEQDLNDIGTTSSKEISGNQEVDKNVTKHTSFDDQHNRCLTKYDDELLGNSCGSEADIDDDLFAVELPSVKSLSGDEVHKAKKRKRVLTEDRKAKRKKAKRIKRAQLERAQGVRRLKLLPVMKPKVVKPCVFYMQGRCQKGTACKFSHDVTPETKSKPCTHFACGTCLKGDECPYDHELSKYPCHNFTSTGLCARGSNCKFSHQKPALENSSSMPDHKKSDTTLVPKLTSKAMQGIAGKTSLGSSNHSTMAISKEVSKNPGESKVAASKEVLGMYKGIRFLSFGNGKADNTKHIVGEQHEENHQRNLTVQNAGNYSVKQFDHKTIVRGDVKTSKSTPVLLASTGNPCRKDIDSLGEHGSSEGPKCLKDEISEASKILQEFLFGGLS